MFEYISNIHNVGWWNELNHNIMNFYLIFAEIVGIKFEHFNNQSSFNSRVQKLIVKDNLLKNFFDKINKLQINSDLLRKITGELNKRRRIRTKKVKRFKYQYVKSLYLCFNHNLPIELTRLIVNEFIDCSRGCVHCEKMKLPIDVIISHDSSSCKFANKSLQCLTCKSNNRSLVACSSHLTQFCTFIAKHCAICKDIGFEYSDHNIYECHYQDNTVLVNGEYEKYDDDDTDNYCHSDSDDDYNHYNHHNHHSDSDDEY
jgi:hypothetical protein